MTVAITDDNTGATDPMVLFEVHADSPSGHTRSWLIVARDGVAARSHVPPPFRPVRTTRVGGDAAGPSRVIGWYGESLSE